MRVNLGTIEMTDEDRKAFRKRFGASGMATRAEIAREAVRAVCDAVAVGRPMLKAPAKIAVKAAARRDGPKCRHCGLLASAWRHDPSSGDLYHEFNAGEWPAE